MEQEINTYRFNFDIFNPDILDDFYKKEESTKLFPSTY